MRFICIGMLAILPTATFAFAQTKTVHFTIDASRDVKPISRFICAVNQFHLFFDGMSGPWSNRTFTRLGGNRLTAYNWTNNASQAGSDYLFHKNDYLVQGPAIPRLKDKIARNYSGTRLAFSEYFYGGGANISDGIAQADVLGILGRDGVFAAALWFPSDVPFIAGAFEMFRDFDGKDGTFGDISIHAETNDVADSSIYASLDASRSTRIVVVAINKTGHPLTAVLDLEHVKPVVRAKAYQLAGAGPDPQSAAHGPELNPESIDYVMPGQSVNTLVLEIAP
jgi:hypothetical protein